MQLFAENPGKFMDTYSTEFEAGFLEILRRKGLPIALLSLPPVSHAVPCCRVDVVLWQVRSV
jgi:hypothetical protein